MSVRFSRQAVRNIEKIVDDIASESPTGASRVRERIRQVTDLLAAHPELGQPTDRPGVRRLLTLPYPYAVFYRLTSRDVIVMRVRHTARNPSGAPRRA